jgi:hypothetical protein
MADAEAIARRALEFAGTYLDANRRAIVEMAEGDLDRLHQAAKIVQAQAQSHQKTSLSREHLAFTLITAAYESLRDKPTA